MPSTTPLKAIQNGLRKYNVTVPAYEIRQIAILLEQDIESDTCIEPLIQHFANRTKTEPISVLTNEAEVSQSQLESLPSVDTPNIISYQQKAEMVTSQASVLGVALSDSDVEVIASNINSQATETDELFSDIRGAISAYIQFQKQASQAKIQTLLADINHEQSQANQEISDALSTGLNNFARELEVSRQSFKSSVRASLKLLAVPKA
ncbi:MAG: hypothetical protein PUP93_28565 [Rhizonema sp. NSF051]|nr:hypothetical protein [Rhizonema sp. NSF051]